MPRFLLKFAFLIALVLTVTSLAARAVGSTQPPNPALRGFTEGCEDKPQPCWYGIVPDVTTIDVAQKKIESMGYTLYDNQNDILYYSYHGGGNTKAQFCSNIRLPYENLNLTISEILLENCDGIVLGDLSIIGFPQEILWTSDLFIKLSDYHTATISQYDLIDIYHYTRKEWSPKTLVSDLYIGSKAKSFNIAIDLAGYPWHGFVPYWRYCQLEPKDRNCTQ